MQIFNQFQVLDQCDILRKQLCSGSSVQNEEIESIQLYFEQMGVHYNERFGEFTKFQNIHHQQQKILDS